MKKLIYACVIVGLLASPGCALRSAPAQSKPVLSAVKAAEVVHALDVARDVAQLLSQESPAVISAGSFQKVLVFHQSAVAIIGATPNGWKSTVEAGLDQLQKDLPPADAARLAPYIGVVKVLVDAFVPA